MSKSKKVWSVGDRFVLLDDGDPNNWYLNSLAGQRGTITEVIFRDARGFWWVDATIDEGILVKIKTTTIKRI